MLLFPPGLRDNKVPPVVMLFSFLVAEAIVLFGTFKDDDFILLVLLGLLGFAKGCREGVVTSHYLSPQYSYPHYINTFPPCPRLFT